MGEFAVSQERTFVAIKPDGVERGLIGEIIGRFEKRGLKLVGLKLMRVSVDLAGRHYGEHKGKPFFDGLVKFITSGPIVAMVWEGKNAITLARNVIGATNPAQAAQGTIRGDLAVEIGRNAVHGSDGPESAAREIGLFFNEDELVNGWSRAVDVWVNE
ncbi:MAG: nucleoside-diphosphate kinase [Candidatus Obscuribacter sp.]|jgi:nucleoside-diphosphate kinase|nr:nucleoside-diphosphate kinase [Candidatus Obscuribacter sp.]MBK7839332.1 nucleoside-diphosphate kinase [Candidatus Obscuribacter sp.]MBK9203062.1 nucleoside-diphosphate kinase [Candidatus Obscuribacter sp.]MBK9619180.1 nucleoside-diphosphate kinase [Candidatus Obscuribacter sp.]MBK9769413.1 nucleoside-diphosphate kinase [Candidatus Obscuribacter sp.]